MDKNQARNYVFAVVRGYHDYFDRIRLLVVSSNKGPTVFTAVRHHYHNHNSSGWKGSCGVAHQRALVQLKTKIKASSDVFRLGNQKQKAFSKSLISIDQPSFKIRMAML